MATQTKKRKYFAGQIYFNIDGNITYRHKIPIFENEIVSYDGAKKIVINRKGVIYDLSEYDFDNILFHPPNSEKSYQYIDGWHQEVNVVATILDGLRKNNFIFPDHFKYEFRDKNGHFFKSILSNKRHYVTGSDFDKYFVPNMEKGEIKGNFTYAKHGSAYWVTLVTD